METKRLKISLRAARVNAGLNLVPAAKAIGVCKDTLIKWEKHSGLVSPGWQKKISEVYNIPIDYIFLEHESNYILQISVKKVLNGCYGK